MFPVYSQMQSKIFRKLSSPYTPLTPTFILPPKGGGNERIGNLPQGGGNEKRVSHPLTLEEIKE